jgi:hypothetical protein
MEVDLILGPPGPYRRGMSTETAAETATATADAVVPAVRLAVDDLVRAGGEDQHGEGVALGTQPAAHLQAVHAWQAQVEHHQVDRPEQRGLQRGGSVLAHLDLVALTAQGAREGFRDGCVVLGQ